MGFEDWLQSTDATWAAVGLSAFIVLLGCGCGLFVRWWRRRRARSGGYQVVEVDADQPVATIELRSQPTLDTAWFEKTWATLADNPANSAVSKGRMRAERKSHLPEIERVLGGSGFVVLASGQRGSKETCYFFAQDSATFRFCLGELVVDTGSRRVTATFRCEDGRALLPAFVANYRAAVADLLTPADASAGDGDGGGS